jgi:hypothetical protein
MQSDLRIPRHTDILDRALDYRESAARLADVATVARIDRLVTNLPSTVLCWTLGTLHLTSPSGGRYQVTRAGCSCPNGTKSSARACWHWTLLNLLIDMFDEQCAVNDDRIEYEAEQRMARRLAAARASYVARL